MNLTSRGLGGSTDARETNTALKSARDGSKLKKRFKVIELRTHLADLKKELALGKPDYVIQETLGVSSQSYNDLKRELYRQETAALYSATTEDVYLEYKWKQEACIGDLEDMIENFKTTKQYNALVGAVRTKSDIIDKVIKTGQEMGIIDKAPEKKLILHGVAIASLDNTKLRKLIANEMQGLASIYKKFGDKDLLGNMLTTGDVETPTMKELPAIELPPAPDFSDRGAPAQASSFGKAAAGRAARVIKRVKQVDVIDVGS